MTPPQKGCERTGCENKLTGRQKHYCSNVCRAIAEHARKNAIAESVALEVIRAQVEPVVKAALTEQVLVEIQVLTELLPPAIAALQVNLADEDPVVRQRAVDTVMKYTVGNTSVAPPAEPPAGAGGINITFGIPQQGDDTGADGSVLEVDGEAVEVEAERECIECRVVKPTDQFIGSSARCQSCHAEMLADIQERFPGIIQP